MEALWSKNTRTTPPVVKMYYVFVHEDDGNEKPACRYSYTTPNSSRVLIHSKGDEKVAEQCQTHVWTLPSITTEIEN